VTTKFLAKFRAGEPVIGTMVMWVRTPGIIRMAASAGLDYVVVDLQHSNLGLETVADMCEVGRAAGIAVFIRPSDMGQDSVNRLQDLGADGFMFHDVTSRAQLDELIRPLTYPPRGTRGIAIGGPGADYRYGGVDADQLAAADDRQVTIVQIESQQGLDNLDSILSGGVDVVDVGRQDLAISLGVPGQTTHALVEAAVDRVLQACAARGKVGALAVADVAEARRQLARGARFLTYRTDKAILLDGYRSFAAGLS
jgi:2-keto-3-deoxy-L-rhamnonate aldolase RhmA